MNTMATLDFCLLIPCYNNFPGLIESLESVIYDVDKFLVVLVDDGSEIAVDDKEIRRRFEHRLPFVLLRGESNQGITKSLNRGLAWIESNVLCRYIARLDCGDLCAPERFSKQVEKMNANPALVLLGSYCRFTDEKTGLAYTYKGASQHDKILKEFPFRNPFMHATVMFRANSLKESGYYPMGYEYAEDYAFFWCLSSIGEVSVIKEVLVFCRVNRGGISFSNKGKQLTARWKVVRKYCNDPFKLMVAFLRLMLLFILPKRLTLHLKKFRG